MNAKYRKLALLLGALMLGACGSDGKDGADGADGAPGTPGLPGEPGTPGQDYTKDPVTTSLTTNLEVLSYSLNEGSVSYEFEITDENDKLINGLQSAEAKIAALTSKGFINNRDGLNGGAATMSTEGAALEVLGDGHYRFTAPMPAVNTATEGLVWLRVGGANGSGIARSKALIVNKPEGVFSTTTESCYSCHVDYSVSPRRHASYVAEGMDGEVNFVEGCLVCHGSVSRSFEGGGYATNTLSKIGHINHQEFTKDFSVMNCSSCHTELTANINITGPGCIDCHNTGVTTPGDILPANGLDVRTMHASAAGITQLKALRAQYTVALSTPVSDGAGGWCSTITVTDADGAVVNISENYNAEASNEATAEEASYIAGKPIVYAGAYLHAYDKGGIVGRPGVRNSESKTNNPDGTRTVCYAAANISTGYENAGYMFSARVTFSTPGWKYYDENVRGQTNNRIRSHGYDGSMGVSFTAYSDVVNPADGSKISGFERRLNVKADSCTTCHNDGTAFHKNGAFDNGGQGCIACHGNGMARTSATYGPGFGPMIHSWHWGNGATVGEVEQNADGSWVQTNSANGASAINPAVSCVACHDGVVDLYAVPAQFILEPSSKMTSPITANCYACHTNESALNHMQQNGGEVSVDAVGEWFKTPTMESCATCHGEGKTFGIDKYHRF